MKSKNKIFIGLSIIVLLISALLFVLGAWVEGWDFAKFFTSNTAYAAYVILGAYLLAVIYLILKDKVM